MSVRRGGTRDGRWILLLFALVGPLIGGLAHVALMTAAEPSALQDGWPGILVSLLVLSYGVGVVPALLVGSAVV